MTQAATLPMKSAVATRDLVHDVAEHVAPHGWRVVKHAEGHDYEKSEKRLTVTMVKNEDGQGILNLSGGGGSGGATNGGGEDPDE